MRVCTVFLLMMFFGIQCDANCDDLKEIRDSLNRFVHGFEGAIVKGTCQEESVLEGKTIFRSDAFELCTSRDNRERILFANREVAAKELLSSAFQTSYFKHGHFALNYNRVTIPSGRTIHDRSTSYVKDSNIGWLRYGTLGHLFGISDLDGTSYFEIVDWNECQLENGENGIKTLVFQSQSLGDYRFEFELLTIGTINELVLRKVNIEKLGHHSIFHDTLDTVSDLQLFEGDPKESISVEISYPSYRVSSNRLVADAFSLVLTERSKAGISAKITASARVTSEIMECENPIELERIEKNVPKITDAIDDENILYMFHKGNVQRVLDDRTPNLLINHGADAQTFPAKGDDSKSGWVYANYLRNHSSAHCGLYSLMMALSDQGVSYDVNKLFDSRFVGSRKGSSANELVNAAAEFGCPACVVDNMTINTLKSSTNPVLLFLRYSRRGEEVSR